MAEKMALSVTEAAEALGISRRSLYNLIKLDGFPVLELGGRRVIRRQAKGCGAYGQPGGAVGAIIPRLSPGAQGGTSK